jgi:hypothetical protein
MYLFLKKLAVFLFISISSFFVVGIYLENIIANNINGNNQYQIQEDWHIKHNIKNEILFLGNSRTWVQIDAKLVTEKINKKAYCLAQDGRDVRMLYYKLKTYLLYNELPEKLFVQFDPFFLKPYNYNTFYGKNNYLAYIYGDRLGINKLFREELGYNNMDEYIPLIRYFNTENGFSIFLNHLKNKKSTDLNKFQFGSELQIKNWNSARTWLNPDSTIGLLNFNYMDSIMSLCKQSKIIAILCYPPQSYPSFKTMDEEMIFKLYDYANKRKIIFWNFNNKKYSDSTLFYNHMHTNKWGSLIYTKDLIDSINSHK